MSLLFETTAIDEPEKIEVLWSAKFKNLEPIFANSTQTEINNKLIDIVSSSKDVYENTVLGIIYGIITTDGAEGVQHFNQLNSIVRDKYAYCISQLRLLCEKYPKLLESSRTQFLWFFENLVDLDVENGDKLFQQFLRQIIGGNSTTENIWLTDRLLTILRGNKDWLYSQTKLIPHVVYTFLRLIPEHFGSPNLDSLRKTEVNFISQLIRDKLDQCKIVGRDLIRVLQDVSKIPELKEIWITLLSNPKSISGTFEDISEFFSISTGKEFLQSRLTPDMETKLLFLMQHVTMGNQKRYQHWFMQKYLTAPESEFLVVDLIRYIIYCYHPTNAVLSSNIMPRWAVIGWLLKCIRSEHVAANAKLALFYDWLFFNDKENIMHIEPAILLMLHSLDKYPEITGGLVEFVALVTDLYDTKRVQLIRNGIFFSFKNILQKRVISSIDPIFNCPFVRPNIVDKIRKIIRSPEINAENPLISPTLQEKVPQKQEIVEIQDDQNEKKNSQTNGTKPQENHSPIKNKIKKAIIIDDESDDVLIVDTNTSPVKDENNKIVKLEKNNDENSKPKKKQPNTKKRKISSISSSLEENYEQSLNDQETDKMETDEDLDIFENIKNENNSNSKKVEITPLQKFKNSKSSQNFQNLLKTAKSSKFESKKIARTISKCIVSLIGANFLDSVSNVNSNTLFPFSLNFLDSQFEDIFSNADQILTEFNDTFFIFYYLIYSKHERMITNLQNLLLELLKLESSIGFRFLSFVILEILDIQFFEPDSDLEEDEIKIKTKNININIFDEKWENFDFNSKKISLISNYLNFLTLRDIENIPQQFSKDCKLFNDEDIVVFFKLLPFLIKILPQNLILGNSELIYIIVSTIYPQQLQFFISALITKELKIFGKKNVVDLVRKSLEWDSFEQMSFWQLINAEFTQAEKDIGSFLPTILDFISPKEHHEVLQGLTFLLKDLDPSAELLRMIILVPDFSRITASIVSNWILFHKDIVPDAFEQIFKDYSTKNESEDQLVENMLKQLTFMKSKITYVNTILKKHSTTLIQVLKNHHFIIDFGDLVEEPKKQVYTNQRRTKKRRLS